MHYAKIKPTDVADGPGVRVSLFVCGCRNHCPGCFQPQTWDFSYGREYTKNTEAEILKAIDHPFIAGLSILGGEPFEPENQREVLELTRAVKNGFPSKTIWVYTGYTYEELLTKKHTEFTDAILENIDVLVDGRFEQAKKNLSLQFRGSSNQRILDIKQTRATGKIVILEQYR